MRHDKLGAGEIAQNAYGGERVFLGGVTVCGAPGEARQLAQGVALAPSVAQPAELGQRLFLRGGREIVAANHVDPMIAQ